MQQQHTTGERYRAHAEECRIIADDIRQRWDRPVSPAAREVIDMILRQIADAGAAYDSFAVHAEEIAAKRRPAAAAKLDLLLVLPGAPRGAPR